MLSNSGLLREKLNLVVPKLNQFGHRIFTNSRVKELYPEYLFVTHCLTRASVPLMEAALLKSRTLVDDITKKLIPYLEKHIPEERHAHWLLEDLEVLGWSEKEVWSRTPPVDVAKLIGMQYYWIEHFHPVALLGYMELAEGYPPSNEQIEDLRERTGFRKEAFRSLRRHAVLDLDHREELHEVLDSLPLSSSLTSLVGLNALECVSSLVAIFSKLLDSEDIETLHYSR